MMGPFSPTHEPAEIPSAKSRGLSRFDRWQLGEEVCELKIVFGGMRIVVIGVREWEELFIGAGCGGEEALGIGDWDQLVGCPVAQQQRARVAAELGQ